MSGKDHNKILGILFAIYGGLSLLGIALCAVIYGGLGVAMMNARGRDEQTMGTFFLVMAIAIIPIGLVMLVPVILAAFKLLKNKSGARFWGIFAAILALFSFPLGTALGIYALWFFMSDAGKQFYNAGGTGYAPPPPPNNWR